MSGGAFYAAEQEARLLIRPSRRSTPHFSGFVVRCSVGVLLIDTGISRAYGGEQSALIIDTELAPEGNEWKETETLTALYRNRVPKIIKKDTRKIGR